MEVANRAIEYLGGLSVPTEYRYFFLKLCHMAFLNWLRALETHVELHFGTIHEHVFSTIH
jgi:hypothetical protein